MSRHRGVKHPRRCELLGGISLLSPAYLLSVERRRFTLATAGSLTPTFVPARLVGLAVKLPICVYALHTIANRVEGTFERLRYILGGDRPSQTARLELSLTWIHRIKLEFKLY